MSARRVGKFLGISSNASDAENGRNQGRLVEMIVKAAIEGPLSKINRDDLDDQTAPLMRGLHTTR